MTIFTRFFAFCLIFFLIPAFCIYAMAQHSQGPNHPLTANCTLNYNDPNNRVWNASGGGTSGLVWDINWPDYLYANTSLLNDPTSPYSYSNWIEASKYNFNIPSNSIITGIEVGVMAHSHVHLGIKIAAVKLRMGGSLIGDEKAGTENLPTEVILYPDIPYQIFGGSHDLWGLNLTAADVNAEDFGAAVVLHSEITQFLATTVYMNHIYVTVHYSLCTALNLSSAEGTDSQTVCIGSAITYIVYDVDDATNVSASGLPNGVTGNYDSGSNRFTISGTPAKNGVFNYTVNATGGSNQACPSASIYGIITVKDLPPDFMISVNNPITEGNPATVTLKDLYDGSYDITYILNTDNPVSVTAASTAGELTFTTRALTLDDNEKDIVINDIGYTGSSCMIHPDKSHILEVEPANAIFKMKVFLMGAYSGNGMMHTKLNNKGLLPLSQPYNVALFNYAGTESVSGFESTVVDWILVSLRDADDYETVLETKALLLHADGHVTDVNDNSEVEFDLPRTSNYYVEVQHRNHLGILTATARDLSGKPTLDFTNKGDTPTYNNTQEAQHEIEQDVMAMYAGNVNGDNRIRNNGPENDNLVLLSEILGNSKSAVLKDAYSFGDIEMNGIVKYNGPNNDHFYLLSIVLGNNKSKIIRRQY